MNPKQIKKFNNIAKMFHELCPNKEFGTAFHELFKLNIFEEYNALKIMLKDASPPKTLEILISSSQGKLIQWTIPNGCSKKRTSVFSKNQISSTLLSRLTNMSSVHKFKQEMI